MTLEKLQHALEGIDYGYLVIEYNDQYDKDLKSEKRISIQKLGHQVTFAKRYLVDDRLDIVVHCLRVLDDNIDEEMFLI